MGREEVDRILNGTALSARESAFHQLVDASHLHDEDARRTLVRSAAHVLTTEEVYHANAVIALFNFYNKFVDLNGVAELTPEGYDQSGVRLSSMGYAPPAR